VLPTGALTGRRRIGLALGLVKMFVPVERISPPPPPAIVQSVRVEPALSAQETPAPVKLIVPRCVRFEASS
jgi:hypothetical protein